MLPIFSEYLPEFVFKWCVSCINFNVNNVVINGSKIEAKSILSFSVLPVHYFCLRMFQVFFYNVSFVYLLAFAREFSQTRFWLGIISHLKCIGLFYIILSSPKCLVICLTCTRSFLLTIFGWINWIMWLPWVLRFSFNIVQRWT